MRRVWALLPLGVLVLIFAEIAVFIALVHAIGALWTLLALAATSLLGLVLLRREGVRGWRAFRASAEAHRPPGEQVSNSLVGLAGALLLAVPGFITAVIGLLMVAPPMRGLVRRGVEGATERRVSSAVAGDLFGPRRVRVRRGDPVPEPQPETSRPIPATVTGEVVEGEIVR
jgi:UPF0716 protein FxsA